MRVPINKLDEGQVFVYDRTLWVVEKASNTGDVRVRQLTFRKRGTQTITSAFLTSGKPVVIELAPHGSVTILDEQMIAELGRP